MANRKKKKNNDKFKKIALVISLLLVIISFLINRSNFIRPLLFIVAILIITIVNIIDKKSKLLYGMVTFIVCIIFSIFLDGIIVFTFKIIPVFSYNIISYDNIRVYNGIGIRVWQCDKNTYKNLIVDPFYKNGYMCDITKADAINANSFLNSVVENYEEYKNNYIKIDGKISKKNSLNLIEMQPYEQSSITINGYVTFADNIVLRILFNQQELVLDDYDVYDDIVVVGIIKNMEKEGDKYVIYMADSKVVSDIGLNEYTLSVTPSLTCKEDKLQFQSDSMNVYTHCIDDIIINYGLKKYELASALSSGKINVSELYEAPDKTESNDEGDKLYYIDSYNVIVCNPDDSKDIIIGDSKMKLKDVNCKRKESE